MEELTLDTVYKVLDNEQPYRLPYLLLPTVQIIGGTVNVWISNKKDKPAALSEAEGMSEIESNVSEPFALAYRYRWIGFELVSDTPELFNNGVVSGEE